MSTISYAMSDLSELIGISESTIRMYSCRAEISKYFIFGRLSSLDMIPFLNAIMPIIGYKPRNLIKPEKIKMAYARRLFLDAREQYIMDNTKEKKSTKWTKPELDLLTYGDDLSVIQERLKAIGSKRTLYAIAKKRSLL